MADHTPVEADPQQIQRAQQMWHNFVRGSKIFVAVNVVVLIALALIFIR